MAGSGASGRVVPQNMASALPVLLPLAGLALGLGLFCAVYANWNMLFGDGRPSIEGVDDTGYWIWVRSAVIDGDLDFANDIARAPTLADDMRQVWLEAPRTASGRVANKYMPGWGVVTLPAFLAGHMAARIGGYEADGWSKPYFVAAWLWHLALGMVGLWWAWLVARRFAPDAEAAVAVLALLIASPVLYYLAGRVGMVHGLLFTLVAGGTHMALRLRDGDDRWWRWLALGGMAGLCLLVRPTSAPYLLFPAVVAVQRFRATDRARRAEVIAATLVPIAACAAVAIMTTRAVHGTWWAVPYPGESFDFARPHLGAILFSPWHGFFYWHPLLFVGVAALAVGAWRGGLPRTWLLASAAIWYLYASWWLWSFGSSFGMRVFEGVVLYAMVGLAWGLGRLPDGRGWRALAAGVIGAGVAAGALLLVLFVVQNIPRHEPVTYRDMIVATGELFSGRTGVAAGR